MIDHIGIAVSDYERSKVFYQTALAPLGYVLQMEVEGFAGFGLEDDAGAIASFWIHQDDAILPSTHFAFRATTHTMVDDFYAAALRARGTDNGKPGLREIYTPTYYAAFILDPDGYNIEAVCHKEAH